MRMTELTRRWLTALRSGQYEQGAGRLYKDDRYCCLGVLAEIADRLKPDGYLTHTDEDQFPLMASLDPSLMELVGMTEDDHVACTAMNDHKQWNFVQIADTIERAINDFDGEVKEAFEDARYR